MDIQKLITKLQKIDIDDLKKINYKKLVYDLKAKPDILIIIIAISITLIAPIYLYSKQRVTFQDITRKISVLEEKIKVIDSYRATQEELNEFINTIPKNITETAFRNQLTDFAESRHIQVKSFSPAKKQSYPLYDLTSIVLDISAKEYKDVWFFVHDLEKSPHPIRIERWAKSRGNSAASSIPGKAPINVTLEIASISFKNE